MEAVRALMADMDKDGDGRSGGQHVSLVKSSEDGQLNCEAEGVKDGSLPVVSPDGFSVGDTVFFTAACKDCPNGDRLVYGSKGEVKGPVDSLNTDQSIVLVKFPHNEACVKVKAACLSGEEPPTVLAGDYVVGDKVFHIGSCKVKDPRSGNSLQYGQEGVIRGPDGRGRSNRLSVLWAGSDGNISTALNVMSKKDPSEKMSAILKCFDTDGDGRIDETEMEVLKCFDMNGDGSIDQTEMEIALWGICWYFHGPR